MPISYPHKNCVSREFPNTKSSHGRQIILLQFYMSVYKHQPYLWVTVGDLPESSLVICRVINQESYSEKTSRIYFQEIQHWPSSSAPGPVIRSSCPLAATGTWVESVTSNKYMNLPSRYSTENVAYWFMLMFGQATLTQRVSTLLSSGGKIIGFTQEKWRPGEFEHGRKMDLKLKPSF